MLAFYFLLNIITGPPKPAESLKQIILRLINF